MRRRLRIAATALLAATVVFFAALTLPGIFGFHTLTVLSGSMAPAIEAGDAVVTRSIHPVAAEPGDVVTFRDPTDGDRLITHRVRSITRRGASVQVVTRGDANGTDERWSAPADGRIGLVVLRIPLLGRLLAAAGGPWGRVILIVLPVLWLSTEALRRIWRPATGVTTHG